MNAQENLQEQPAFNPGEVLAKFEQGTSGSEAAAKTAESAPLDFTILAPEIARLADKTGVPLTASQLSGGGWFVLSVDGMALTDRLLEMLAAQAPVATVELEDEPAPAPGITVPEILVRFKPGTAEALAVADRQGGGPGVGLDSFLDRLQANFGSPLGTETTEAGRLAIRIDVAALTLSLVDRLDALPEIEAAELNYILQIGV